MRGRGLFATATSLALLAPAAIGLRELAGTTTTTAAPTDARAAAQKAYGNLPISFQANHGQSDPKVKFMAQGSNSTLFLTAEEAVLSLTRTARASEGSAGTPTTSSAVLRTRFLGANPAPEVSGRQALPGKVNHFRGADPAGWHTNIPTFGKVAYAGIYPGIDLVYYSKLGQTEYDFVVAPGADPAKIRLGFEGAQGLSIDAKGDLVAQTALGEVRQHAPVLYQRVGAKKVPVTGAFVLEGDQVSFSVGRYDATLALVIDPVIDYSTWVGGGGADVGFGLAVANDGSAFLAGETGSTNFPTSGSVSCGGTVTTSYQCNMGLNDAFVTKLNAAGSALVYSTYLGGDGNDFAHELAIDAHGNAYVTGGTVSYDDPATPATEASFPTANAYDAHCGTDGNCNAPQHAADFTCPSGATCPTAGLWDAFVSKLSSDGASLSYSTYLGGSNQENNAQGIAVAGLSGIAVSGSKAYVGGHTGSNDFPTSAGAVQPTCGTAAVSGCDNGNGDGYLTVLDTAQSGSASLVYSSYLGGGGHEEVRSVAVDEHGDAFLTGSTYGYDDGAGGTTNNFPTTTSALQTSYQGGLSDAFVVKVNDIAGLHPDNEYATYLGGGGWDQGWGIAVGTGSTPTVTGWTNSGDDPATPDPDGPTPYFPTTTGAYDTTFNGRATGTAGYANYFYDGDAFVSRLTNTNTGMTLVYSTFIGGTDMDVATSVAVDATGNAYITGYTTCQNDNGGVPLPPGGTPPGPCSGSFPMQSAIYSTMDGSYINYENHNAPTDVFVAKLSATGTTLLFSTYLGGRDFDRGFAIAVREKDGDGLPITPEIFITGRMASAARPDGTGAYPTTAGSFQPTKPSGNGNRDVAVTKITGL